MPGSTTTTRIIEQDIPLRNNLRASSGVVTFTRATSAWAEDDAGVVQSYATNIPRISPTKGLFVEGVRINVQTNNAAMNLWTRPFGVTGSADTADTLDPLGTNTAEKIVEDGTTLAHGMDNGAMTTMSGSSYVVSCYLKKGTRDWFRLNAAGGAAGNVWFNITTLATGSTPGAGITNVTLRAVQNGWVRISAVFGKDEFFTGTSKFFGVYHATGDNNINFTGTVNDYFYAWGFQAESVSTFLGGYPSTPIITGAAAVQRNLESNSFSLFGSAREGTISLKFTPNVRQADWLAGVNMTLIDTCQAGGEDGVLFYFEDFRDGILSFYFADGGVGTTSINTAALTWTVGVTYSVSCTWSRGRALCYRNGVLVASNVTGNVRIPTTYATAVKPSIGMSPGTTWQCDGYVHDVRVSRI